MLQQKEKLLVKVSKTFSFKYLLWSSQTAGNYKKYLVVSSSGHWLGSLLTFHSTTVLSTVWSDSQVINMWDERDMTRTNVNVLVDS